MVRVSNVIYLFVGLSIMFGESDNVPNKIIKEFIPAGSIDALIGESSQIDLVLIQLDLKNDSLFNLINTILPDMELFSGPASYHRIIEPSHLKQIQEVLSDEFYFILNENYNLPNSSRDFWVDLKQGSETQGTWSDDDAIEYTCGCLSGASDCVKLGWDDSWWNPLDYWGEAWYGYQPPYYESIDEIRITVRGGQCDDLPIWSETYMGMMDDNGNWSHDYELSINYTDNVYVVGNIWSGSMLMPRIGSEDNYCVDTIKIEFFYNCDEPESVSNLLASDGEDCYIVNLAWSLSPSITTQQILYRDDTVIAQLDPDNMEYEDWGAQSGTEHIYCLEVQNECGNSNLTCNPGSVKTEPDPPSNVIASDGEYTNEVLLSWLGTDITDNYKIYRDGVWMGIVPGDQLEYTDIIPELEIVYEYCIESVNGCGESGWRCDTGYSALPGGDVNEDGSIDVLDIVVVVNIIIGNYTPSYDEFLSADMNSDGVLDVLDIVILINAILGLSFMD